MINKKLSDKIQAKFTDLIENEPHEAGKWTIGLAADNLKFRKYFGFFENPDQAHDIMKKCVKLLQEYIKSDLKTEAKYIDGGPCAVIKFRNIEWIFMVDVA